MSKFNLKSFALWAMGIVVLSCISLSCKKDDPTVVVITVLDTIGQKVNNASVRLYGRPTDSSKNETDVRFDSIQLTDANGQVRYDLTDLTKPGQAGFAVLDITAFKEDLQGVGIVNVIEQKTTNQSIRIQ